MAEPSPSLRLLLTPCACDLGDTPVTPVVVTYSQISNLPPPASTQPYWPNTYCIPGINAPLNKYVKCWKIEVTELPVTPIVGTFFAKAQFSKCVACVTYGSIPISTLPIPVPPPPKYGPCFDCQSCVNYLLTPCCGNGGTEVIAPYNLINIPFLPPPPSVGSPPIYCIPGIRPNVNCWSITITSLPATLLTPFTAIAYYRDCSRCNLASGLPQMLLPITEPPSPPALCPQCKGCIYAYFNLLDCCTNLPYKDSNGNIIYLEYNGIVTDPSQPTPATFVSPVVIKTIYNNTEDLIASGCLKLNEVLYDSTVTYLNWATQVYTAEIRTECKYCKECKPCYRLINCENPLITMVVISPLSAYLGKVIVIVGGFYPPDTSNCWYVELNENCLGITTEVQVSKSYAECCECTGAYKLTDCSNSSNTLLTVVNLSNYINKVITIQGSTVCWRVSIPETCTGTKTNVIVVNTLSDCSKCRGCFLLVNCEDATDFEYVIDPNLTQYANTTVILKFGTKCYKVLYDPYCEGEPATLDVAVSFTDTSTQTGCEQCIPTPKPPKLTNERPVRPGYIKPVCPNNCESGCSDCNSCNNC